MLKLEVKMIKTKEYICLYGQTKSAILLKMTPTVFLNMKVYMTL